jgi:hypothetical protein
MYPKKWRQYWHHNRNPVNYHLVMSPATCLIIGFTARMGAIPGVTYKYRLSPKLAASSVVCVINLPDVQTDLGNDVITSINFTARMCTIPGVI